MTVDEETKKESLTKNEDSSLSSASNPEDKRKKESPNSGPERQARSSRMQIDRAKPRKSPRRPLPGKNKYL